MAAEQATLAPDLRYLLREEGISEEVQARVGELGYVTVKLFLLIGQDRAGVKEFCRTELALDATASAAKRLAVAKVISAW